MSKELTQEMIGLDRISPTQLQCYEDCPLLFYYAHWIGLKLDDDDRMHMEFGNSVQRAIEFIYAMYDNSFGGGWEGAKDRFDEVEAVFKQNWPKSHVSDTSFQNFMNTKAGRESGFKSKSELYKAMYDDGVKILESYWRDKELLITQFQLDLSEFEMMVRVPIVNPTDPTKRLPIPLSGRIDAKNRQDTKLIDFKTSKGSYNGEESRKLMQCRAYPFMWHEKTGKWILDFDYVVLRKGLKSDDRVQVVQLHFDEGDMLAFYHQVDSILTKISNREFSRPRSGHASWCDCYNYEKLLNITK